MAHVLGLDLGTSSLKAALLCTDSSVVATASYGYPVDTPLPGWAEQDPQAWWQALHRAVADVLSAAAIRAAEIDGIAIGGQMHGTVLLDAHGSVLRPAIIWPDERAYDEARSVEALLASHDLLPALGGTISSGFMLASLAWCRSHEPQTWRLVARALLPKDYLRYRLTGTMSSEPSDGSGIPLVDLARGTWHAAVLDLLDLPEALFPPLRPSMEVAGTVTHQAAGELGLAAGTPVYGGGSDQAMAALGAGVLTPGTLLISISTGGQIVTPIERPLSQPALGVRSLCHILPGRYLALAATLGAGLSVRWMREWVAAEGALSAAEADGHFVALAASAPPGAGGLLFLPYLVGERAPLLDPDATGALVGLRLDHGRAHLARATLEGVVFSLRHALEQLEAASGRAARILLAGGLARNPLVQRIAADLLGRPVACLVTPEQSALGAAILAAVGAGLFPDLASACAASVTATPVIEPRPAQAILYGELYACYCGLYPALCDNMHALRGLGTRQGIRSDGAVPP